MCSVAFAQNLSTGLVGYYPFNGNAGDSASLPPLNNGTVNGAIFGCGVFDSAIVFDGVNDYVELDTNFYLDSTYSISFWINPYSVHNGTIFAMRKQCSTSGRGWSRAQIMISGDNTGLLLNGFPTTLYAPNQIVMGCYRCDSSCSGFHNCFGYTVPGLSIDTLCYTHVVITVENNDSNDTREFKAYVNGQYHSDTLFRSPPASSLATTPDPFNLPSAEFESYFGITHDYFTFTQSLAPLHGALDHVRIYQRKISAAEVAALYAEGLPAIPISLVFADSLICSEETDTISAPALVQCDSYYWLINDSLVSTDTFALITASGNPTDTVRLVYSFKNFCQRDTLQQVFYVHYPTDSVFDTICSNDSVLFGGNWINQAGTYYDTLNSSVCDSIIVYMLSVSSTSRDTVQVVTCWGDSMYTGGSPQNQPGYYVDSFYTSHGCDSVQVTNLLFEFANTDTVETFICPGDSFLVNGTYESVAGYYLDTLAGTPCDTLHTFHLHLWPVYLDTVMVTTCWGSSVTAGGSPQSQPGYYVDSFYTSHGCDSIQVTDLVFEYYNDTTEVSICQGDSFLVDGNYESISGYYPEVITGNNCDTLRHYHLTVIAPVFIYQNLALCHGDSMLLEGGYQSTAGTYYDTLAATSGCDSIIVSTVSVYYESAQFNHQICQGDSIWLVGQYRYSAGVFTDTTANAGCDTIVNHLLTVISTQFTTQALDLCIGDSVFLANAWRTSAGIFTDTLTSTVTGCDSINTTFLSFHYEQQTINASICQGETYVPSGLVYEEPGTFRDTITSGICEVIRNHVISVIPRVFIQPQAKICRGDSIYLGGHWQDTAGKYIDTLSSAVTGCDSIVTTTLSIEELPVENVNITMCTGDSVFAAGTYRFLAGDYTDTTAHSKTSACSTIVYTHVTLTDEVLTRPAISIEDSGYCPQPIVTLDANVPVPGIIWSTKENSRVINHADSGWVYVDYHRCNHVLRDSLYVPGQDCFCVFYFPNAFTPEHNNLNEVYRPLYECPFHHYELTIYNRWGQAVFHTTDPEEGWDGTVDTESAQEGSYVYVVRYALSPKGADIVKRGPVVLIR